ncbi:MAG TPA: hypothetical protein VMD07_08300 [Candidatus Acidoferrales bacterium]|nr:hypothetical protein [Candidatus Acidoferrales bacterium]
MFRVLSAFLAVGLLILQTGTAQSAAVQNAQSVMAKVAKSTDAPRSFEAATQLQLKQRSFPFTKVALSGTSYFQAPNRLAVRFTKVPGYMSGLPKAYATLLNVGAWPQEYNATMMSPQSVNGHTDFALQLTPKSSQSTDRGVVLVNPANWTVDQVNWNLSGGVTLAMTEAYTDVGSYRVPSSQSLSVHTPYATADGSATLQNYAVNVPIDNGIFASE